MQRLKISITTTNVQNGLDFLMTITYIELIECDYNITAYFFFL